MSPLLPGVQALEGWPAHLLILSWRWLPCLHPSLLPPPYLSHPSSLLPFLSLHACLVSPAFLVSSPQVPSPSSCFSSSFYLGLPCLTCLRSTLTTHFSFLLLWSLPPSSLLDQSCLALSSEPPGSPSCLLAGPGASYPGQLGGVSVGPCPWATPWAPSLLPWLPRRAGSRAQGRGEECVEGGSTWPSGRQGRGVAGRASWHREGTRGRGPRNRFGSPEET